MDGEIWLHVKSALGMLWKSFSWPHVAIISIFLVLIVFRVEIKAVLRRMTKIGLNGAEFANPPIPVEKQSGNNGVESLVVEGVAGDSSSTTISGKSKGIPLPPFAVQSSMQVTTSFIEKEIETVPESELREYLVSRLAMMRVLWDFEATYSLIFGGQIRFLKRLNSNMSLGCGAEDAERIWCDHKLEMSPNLDAWSREQYLRFLISKELIRFDGNTYFINAKGHDFLVWLAQSMKSEDKPF